jgi:hypothetical protein
MLIEKSFEVYYNVVTRYGTAVQFNNLSFPWKVSQQL